MLRIFRAIDILLDSDAVIKKQMAKNMSSERNSLNVKYVTTCLKTIHIHVTNRKEQPQILLLAFKILHY